MAFTLTMPVVGETVTEGTIERWLKQPGDPVKKYEPIVEINTDKVNVELPSPVSGTVLEHLAKEGDTIPVGAALCTIEAVAGETPADIAPPAADTAAAPPSAPPKTGLQSGTSTDAGPNRATPRVRRLAAELGVNLASVHGTGPGGRIMEEDVRAAGQSPAPSGTGPDEEIVSLTSVRRTIAQRMTQSALTVPVAWLVVEADVTGLADLRRTRKEEFRKQHGADLTYLAFAAHAVARALIDHPYLNASWSDDSITLKKGVNLGIAVATDRGLLVPVIRAADGLGVTALAVAIADLGERARANRLRLEDVQGGTFTLDNTGAFGSIISQPIINLGQAAIMSLEAVTRRPVVVDDDAVAVRSVVNLCLSFDHRVLDGHQAGTFLQDVKKRFEAFGPDSSID